MGGIVNGAKKTISTIGKATTNVFTGKGNLSDVRKIVTSDLFDQAYNTLNPHKSDGSDPGSATQTQLEELQLENLLMQQEDIKNFKPFVLQQYGLQEARDSEGNVTGYEYTPEQKARNTTLQQLADQSLDLQRRQGERQKQALDGTLPLSQQLIQQRDKDFAALKEDQGRNGNEILGDSIDGAVAKTTSGQQALESLKKTYGLLANNEQNAAINQAALPGVYGQQYQISSQNASPGAPNIALEALNPAGFSAAYQPYQARAALSQNNNQFNASASNSFNNSLLTGLLSAAGTYGAYAYAASSKTFKKNISTLTVKDEEELMQQLNNTPIHRYHYNEESEGAPRHVGFITEEAPPSLVTEDGKHISVVDYLGVMTVAMRCMTRKLDLLATRAGV